MKSIKRIVGTQILLLAGATGALADNGTWGSPHSSAAACFEATQVGAQEPDQLKSGLESCAQALNKGPHTSQHKATVHYNSALIHKELGQLGAAQQQLDQAIALDPKLTEAIVLSAYIAHHEQQYGEAAALYNELLKEHASHEAVVANRPALEANRESVVASIQAASIASP